MVVRVRGFDAYELIIIESVPVLFVLYVGFLMLIKRCWSLQAQTGYFEVISVKSAINQ